MFWLSKPAKGSITLVDIQGVVYSGPHSDSHGVRDKTKKENVRDSIRVVPDYFKI